MTGTPLLLLACLAALAPRPAAAAPPPDPSLPDLVEKVLPGVVNISSTTIIQNRMGGWEAFLQGWGVPRERRQSSLGSGFVIDREGFVMTNYHVVAEADEVEVTLFDKRQFRARIVGKDQKLDLALLRIQDAARKVPTNLSPLAFGDSEAIRIAETVFAVGNPFGLQHTVTVGILSAKHRTVGQGPFDNFLQTDASINPGNSGGPLFNLKGQVVGINTMIFSRTGQSGGLGFAIPAHEVERVLPDLKRLGRVPRPWLGLLGERNTAQTQAYYRLGSSRGILVYNLVDGGPADRAGLVQGDIVLEIDGVAVDEPFEIERALAKRKPKERTRLKLQRGRRTLEISVGLEELPRLDRLPEGII